MDHTYVEAHEVADRYVLGRLGEEEAERFEEHYLSCPECLDRIELAEAMRRGFRRVAAEETAKAAIVRQLALVAWLGRLGRSRQVALLAMALLVAVLVPAGLVLRGRDGTDGELSAARSALDEERTRAAASAEEAERVGAEAERLRGELAASQGNLEREREKAARANAELSAELERARAPQANVPILFLGAERGGPAAGEPTFQLRLPAAPGRVVLALEVDPPLRDSYGVILSSAGGRELWRGSDLRPNEMGTLSLSLPTTLLPPGDYAVAVAAAGPAVTGSPPPAPARFAFRVLPPAR